MSEVLHLGHWFLEDFRGVSTTVISGDGIGTVCAGNASIVVAVLTINIPFCRYLVYQRLMFHGMPRELSSEDEIKSG